MNSMVIFHSYVNVCQRVKHGKTYENYHMTWDKHPLTSYFRIFVVDLHINSMVIFHSYVNVYHRVLDIHRWIIAG